MTYPSNALFLLDFLQTHVKNALLILLFNQAHENMGFLSVSKLQPAPNLKNNICCVNAVIFRCLDQRMLRSQQLKIKTIVI
jgi:hypothetical protein